MTGAVTVAGRSCDHHGGVGDDGCDCRVISLNDLIVVAASEMTIFD